MLWNVDRSLSGLISEAVARIPLWLGDPPSVTVGLGSPGIGNFQQASAQASCRLEDGIPRERAEGALVLNKSSHKPMHGALPSRSTVALWET